MRGRVFGKTLIAGRETSNEEMRRRILGAYWPVADAEAVWMHYANRRASIQASPGERGTLVRERLARLDEDIRRVEGRLSLPKARLADL